MKKSNYSTMKESFFFKNLLFLRDFKYVIEKVSAYGPYEEYGPCILIDLLLFSWLRAHEMFECVN